MAKYFAGDTVTKTFTFTDENGDEFDPDAVSIEVVDPDGVTVETLDIDDLTQTATGVYVLRYNLPSTATAGMWRLRVAVSVTENTLQETEEYPFAVSTHPYGDLQVVKHLTANADSTAEDDTLTTFMQKATDFVNNKLQGKEKVLPLDPVPPEVASVAEFYAAGLYMQKDQPDEKEHPYIGIARGELDTYLASAQKYKSEFKFAII
jgi:hypothetical protein